MEQDILEKFKQQDEKLEQIFISVEKTRKYFLWTMIISIGAVVLPLIGLVAIIPWFLSTMSSAYSGLGL
ncbi:MAG: hypothetical protein M0P97_01765 [Candidatus Moranbacteria bacterium]|jgi:hypothetical protein|nr:hypothetical protein [Candidatus Moranbacteria bacterium]